MIAQNLLQDLQSRGVIVTAAGDKINVEGPENVLTDDLLVTLREHKAGLLAALAPKPGTCPACLSALDQQSNDCWYCSGCRVFYHTDGRLMASQARPQPLTREILEAQQLVADLQSVGCSITVTGNEVAIGNLTKMIDELWARFEEVGPEFIQVAKEVADAFDNEKANQWQH